MYLDEPELFPGEVSQTPKYSHQEGGNQAQKSALGARRRDCRAGHPTLGQKAAEEVRLQVTKRSVSLDFFPNFIVTIVDTLRKFRQEFQLEYFLIFRK